MAKNFLSIPIIKVISVILILMIRKDIKILSNNKRINLYRFVIYVLGKRRKGYRGKGGGGVKLCYKYVT